MHTHTPHSDPSSRLDIGLNMPGLFFETPELAPAAVEPVAAPEPVAPVAPEPVAPAAPQFGEADIQRMIVGTLEQILSQPDPTPAAPAAPALPAYDPWDPESVAAHSRAEAERLFEERLGPITPVLDTIMEREGAAVANAAIDQLEATHGRFQRFVGEDGIERVPGREAAVRAAAYHVSQGVPPRAALEHAFAFELSREQGIVAANSVAREQALTNMHGPGAAQPPAGAAAAVATEGVPTGPNRYREQVKRSAARLGLAGGVGIPAG